MKNTLFEKGCFSHIFIKVWRQYLYEKFKILPIMKILISFLPILTTGLGIYLALKTNLLKANELPNAKYSFHKTQLWFWTMIIVPCVFIFIVNDQSASNLNNETMFVLLGISLTSAAGAEVIVATQQLRPEKLPITYKSGVPTPDSNNRMKVSDIQNSQTETFFIDILTNDKNQFSIARFQSFLFTIVFGIVYLYLFFVIEKSNKLPDFTKEVYILLGISKTGLLISKSNFS